MSHTKIVLGLHLLIPQELEEKDVIEIRNRFLLVLNQNRNIITDSENDSLKK